MQPAAERNRAGNRYVGLALEGRERIEKLFAALLHRVGEYLLDLVRRLSESLTQLRSGLSDALQDVGELALASEKVRPDKLELVGQRALRYLLKPRLLYLFQSFEKAAVRCLRGLRTVVLLHLYASCRGAFTCAG